MIKNISDTPFSAVLNNLLDDYSGNNRIIEEKTIKMGKKIGMRNLQRYRNGDSVPSLDDALFIIKACGEDCDIEELKASLALSKEIKQATLAENTKPQLVKKICINGTEFQTMIPVDEAEIVDIINERVESLYPGDKRGFSKYIKDLISKDINENILKGEQTND